MAEFLLELLSEEIPARMQGDAGHRLSYHMASSLSVAGLIPELRVSAFWTPRRLTILFKNVFDVSKTKTEKRKGPRVDAPQQALDGFLKSCGVKKENLLIEEDKKGMFYVAEIIHKGRPAEKVLAEILPELIRSFSWPKSMLWGEGDFRWVRPLHSITAVLGGKPVVFEVGGIKSGSHSVRDFDDYCAKLKKAGIILENTKRIEKILSDRTKLYDKHGLRVIEDWDLLDEISGLVESPFCIMGEIDKQFLKLPDEVLRTSMKVHQKFLSVVNENGKITNFITVANKHKPSKSVQEIILKGNQRVLSARLADAKFFWENDLRTAEQGMKSWAANLDKMTFHNLLGTQGDRIKRITSFAKTHADLFEVNAKQAEATARLMKLDLCSEMVGEFPELQGIMGKYYTEHAKHHPYIAIACKEHYAPLGQDDTTPTAPLSVLMALADKLDTLAGFWAVGLTPTSSKDPFALRRAALGVIRLILDNRSRHSLQEFIASASKPFKKPEPKAQENLLTFFQDRLKIYLREKEGIQPDTIDACLLGELPDDLTFLYNRAKALQNFRVSPECENLLQGFKRAHNILTAEQKKDGVFYEMPPEEQYFQDPTEGTLFKALEAAEKELPKLLEAEKFPEMLKTLAKLRTPIDTFFEAVQVNSEVEIVRRNRLCLLHKICSTMKTFADFSLLNG